VPAVSYSVSFIADQAIYASQTPGAAPSGCSFRYRRCARSHVRPPIGPIFSPRVAGDEADLDGLGGRGRSAACAIAAPQSPRATSAFPVLPLLLEKPIGLIAISIVQTGPSKFARARPSPHPRSIVWCDRSAPLVSARAARIRSGTLELLLSSIPARFIDQVSRAGAMVLSIASAALAFGSDIRRGVGPIELVPAAALRVECDSITAHPAFSDDADPWFSQAGPGDFAFAQRLQRSFSSSSAKTHLICSRFRNPSSSFERGECRAVEGAHAIASP